MINENELPQNWKIVKVGDICDVVRGGSPRPAGDPKYYGGNIPFLKVADLTKDSNVYLQTYKYTITEAGLHKTRRTQPNTLLLTNSGATLGVPKICLIDATFNDGIAAFLNLEPRSNLYLYYFWLTKTKSLRNINQGAAQPNLNTDIIKNVEIPLPPLAEQERIVAKIEELFSELDAGLESLKTAQAQLKTYRQAVLKYAFEGKLTNDNVNKGELPNGWKWVKLEELAESVRNGYGKKPDDKGIFPILRISSVRPFKINLKDVRFLEKPLDETIAIKENDLLFTRYNGSRDFVGVCARVPELRGEIFYPDKLIRCRLLVKSEAHSMYLQYAVNMGVSRQFVLSKIKTTAGQTGISGQEIKSIPIPLCSLEEQQRVVEEIESRLSVCDKLEETINASLKQAEALRQSILKQAFEGKLVKPKEIEKPKRMPFYQMQTLGLIVDRSKQRNIRHGEMTLAKYAFLADKIYGVPIYDKYDRWHLGPYPTAIKKTVNNREYFKIENNTIRVLNEEKLFKYKNDYQEQIETAVDELAEIFLTFEPKDRSHKTELLATVCKVIEDIQTTEIKAVRQSMAEWKIDLKDKRFNNKAEKFDEKETAKCVNFIIEKGWDKKLIA